MPDTVDHDAAALTALYNAALPGLAVSTEGFCGRLGLGGKDAAVFTEKINGELAGFAAADGKAVRMIAVGKKYRGRGIGGRLLTQAEEHIRAAGGKSARLGIGNGYLMQGVPDFSQGKGGCEAKEFFVRRGYDIDGFTEDLTLELSGFETGTHGIYAPPENVTFGWADYSRPGEAEELVNAVKLSGEYGWVRYYEDKPRCIVARMDGKIVGFEMVDYEGFPFEPAFGGKKLGGVGCVGVIPAARKKGIGLRMVEAGTGELKRGGTDVSYIGYTAVYDWYMRLGYKEYCRFWMGEKRLG